jgi:hypothetical protein
MDGAWVCWLYVSNFLSYKAQRRRNRSFIRNPPPPYPPLPLSLFTKVDNPTGRPGVSFVKGTVRPKNEIGNGEGVVNHYK